MIRIYTEEQNRRAKQALAETIALILTEQSYLPNHQKADYLNETIAHKARLIEAIEAWEAK